LGWLTAPLNPSRIKLIPLGLTNLTCRVESFLPALNIVKKSLAGKGNLWPEKTVFLALFLLNKNGAPPLSRRRAFKVYPAFPPITAAGQGMARRSRVFAL
jgi:hypothetical protein